MASGISPICVRQPRMTMPNFAARYFGNRPGRYAHRGFARRRTTAATIVAQTILLLVGVIGVTRTEQIFDRAVILRTRSVFSISRPILVPVVTPSKTPERF